MHYLIGEFKELENSKIDKIYHTKDNYEELLMVVHVTGKGKHILRIMLPSIICMDYSKEEQGVATGFCMMLRKHLEGANISNISQTGFERIIILTIQKKELKYNIIIELFGKGNIIFCDSDMKILNLLYEQKWKDRDIKRGLTYQYPRNTTQLDEKMMQEVIKNSERESIVKTLAMNLNLGGRYAEEICFRTGIKKETSTKNISDQTILIIISEIKNILNQKIKANSNSKNVFPFEMKTILPEKYYDTFNQAVASNIESIDKLQESHEKQKEKVNAIIEEQKKVLKETEKEAEENQKKAESIYENYKELESIVNAIKDVRKKYGWKEIQRRIKEDAKFSKIIVDIDEKNSSIILEMDELK